MIAPPFSAIPRLSNVVKVLLLGDAPTSNPLHENGWRFCSVCGTLLVKLLVKLLT